MVKEDNETNGESSAREEDNNKSQTRKREGGGKPEKTLIAGLD